MKTFTLFLFFITALEVNAQIIYQSWVTRYNNSRINGNDAAKQVVIDNSGNTYVTGYSFDNSQDYLTVKYNSTGAQQWAKRYQGAQIGSSANAIAVDAAGNIYVTGTVLTVGYYWISAIVTVKYNSAGEEQWPNPPKYSGSESYPCNQGNSIAVDNSGNIYVTGRTAGNFCSDGNFVTIKYNSSGVQQWASLPENSHNVSIARKIVIDETGNSYVTGYTVPYGENQHNYQTIKYNTDGTQQWLANYNGSANQNDDAYDIALDNDGNVYVTGSSWENVAGSPHQAITTIKYDNNGNPRFKANYFPPSEGAIGTSLALYLPGGTNPNAPDVPYLYVAGYSSGSGTQYDYTLIQYDLSLTQKWVARYDGTGNRDDWANDVAVDVYANAYVTGYTTNPNLDHDYTTLKYSPGGALKWVGTYDGPVHMNDEAQSIVSGYPADFYITGSSFRDPITQDWDYATIKYSTSWIVLSSGITDNLRAISLVGKDTAFAVGSEGRVIFTSNSGLNWISQSSSATRDLNSVYFLNSNTGFAVGDSGTILRTTDAGTNWSSQSVKNYANLNGIHFITTDKGTTVGSDGTIMQTTDAGSTWLSSTSGTGKNLNSVFFTGSSNGVAVGNSGTILRTTDGGLSWLSQSIGSNNLNSVRFANSNKGIAVGDKGTVLLTNDGGAQWDRAPYDSTSKLRNVYCLDTSVYYAVGDAGLIISTTNSGGEWNVQPSGVTHNLGGVVIADLNTGISVGDNGTILLTTLGDVTGSGSEQNHPLGIDNRSSDPLKFTLYQNYPNPFNPTTDLKYSIPQNAKVLIKVYNVIGEEVAELVNEFKSAGNYSVTFDGTNLSSGVYFYRIVAGEFTDAKKMILLK